MLTTVMEKQVLKMFDYFALLPRFPDVYQMWRRFIGSCITPYRRRKHSGILYKRLATVLVTMFLFIVFTIFLEEGWRRWRNWTRKYSNWKRGQLNLQKFCITCWYPWSWGAMGTTLLFGAWRMPTVFERGWGWPLNTHTFL